MNSAEDNILIQRSFTSVVADYYQLTKPGITMSVLVSMLVGFILGSGANINFVTLIHALIGTYLIAAGTGAHNQFLERNFDGLMKRTSKRPLPDQRIDSTKGMIFSLSMIFSGLLYLILLVNPVAGAVSFVTTLIYLGIYTPMKRVSAINIAIGAIPGALPPVGGWAAATGNIAEPGMWLLFGIMFLWQVPHVLSIAWLCKDDYSSAGFKMLPKRDEKGYKTVFFSLICTLSLFPVTIAIYQFDISGMIFLVSSLIFAVGFLAYTIRFSLNRTKENAKKMMFASIAYLPLVWVAVFIDRFFV
ncbi:MAG: protoheme IX farnesyltransferase [Balneola sp.]|jgi:protoheme IX farnesyltransferase|nr:protoheme IX farnesyltransferase [Balneola sp.]MBE78855.1 protoheme IX farnesyltransferase [Balneola sp.]|tara:strand:- start:172 stop:1077 length:906 start_codon:yes stop_codon:yes gene_type:complete